MDIHSKLFVTPIYDIFRAGQFSEPPLLSVESTVLKGCSSLESLILSGGICNES